MLSPALTSGASGPTAANLATTGGQTCAATRCGYFQEVTTHREQAANRIGCSALEGLQSDHAILGAF